MNKETAQHFVKQLAFDHADAFATLYGKDGKQLLDLIRVTAKIEVETEDATHFDAFWDAYPPGKRKVDRKGCWRLWKRDDLDREAQAIMSALVRQKLDKDWTKSNGSYVPMPAVYLHQQRWIGMVAESNQFDGFI